VLLVADQDDCLAFVLNYNWEYGIVLYLKVELLKDRHAKVGRPLRRIQALKKWDFALNRLFDI
jgi:hypothetical protein